MEHQTRVLGHVNRDPHLMFRITFFAILLLITGCFNSSPSPLTSETIRIVSNTQIQSASVTFPDGKEIDVPPGDYELFRQLFRELAPVKSTHDGPGLPGLPQYEMMLFSAGNVANIRVIVRDDGTLMYSLDEFHYEGGDAERFVAAANAIRSRLAAQ